ncbi:hypothetical protein Y032_0015g2741 [Ancylostoma ceylanicum]|uniref:Uncharacterized protein n=1 Tax=Ancylostoma ceylanicum TaxID=53326 RepID=A0A016VA67_9BILA|nr:hypothetical protein Y032_0015g2741 [Ancylostoma ceylanicum]
MLAPKRRSELAEHINGCTAFNSHPEMDISHFDYFSSKKHQILLHSSRVMSEMDQLPDPGSLDVKFSWYLKNYLIVVEMITGSPDLTCHVLDFTPRTSLAEN